MDFLKDYSLVWDEDFGGQSSLNEANWNREVWPSKMFNEELQAYVADESLCFVKDGVLSLVAEKSCDGLWRSARISSAGKKGFKYGYFEASIKLPEGEGGVWPAFWMMPEAQPEKNNGEPYAGAYGHWPSSGELDILEYSPSTFGDDVYGTIHYGNAHEENGAHYYRNLMRTSFEDGTSSFHRYGMLWTEDEICFYYDGVPGKRVYRRNGDWRKWPFDQPFHFILNVAMGGNLGGEVPEDMTKAVMQVQYVRVYQKKGQL